MLNRDQLINKIMDLQWELLREQNGVNNKKLTNLITYALDEQVEIINGKSTESSETDKLKAGGNLFQQMRDAQYPEPIAILVVSTLKQIPAFENKSELFERLSANVKTSNVANVLQNRGIQINEGKPQPISGDEHKIDNSKVVSKVSTTTKSASEDLVKDHEETQSMNRKLPR